MGHQWGLGMLWNAGEGTNILDTELDADFQNEIDRIQLIAKFKGIFFGVSWDFVNKGFTVDPLEDVQGIPRDGTREDDTRQWSFLIAAATRPDRAREAAPTGQVGIRNRRVLHLSHAVSVDVDRTALSRSDEAIEASFVRRDAKVHIPDVFIEAKWKTLTLRLEIAGILGKIQNIDPGEFPPNG